MNWIDRLRDWANQKGAWTHILMGAGIAVVIMAIIMVVFMPNKDAVNANAANIAQTQETVGTVANALGSKASQASVDALSGDITDALGNQAADISDLDERTAIAETKLAQARADITVIQGQVAGEINSPLAATLNGTFGNYTLSVKSSETGNFTAKVYLVYQPAMGNATSYVDALDDFYAGLNWAVNATIPQYIAVPTFNNTTWGVGEVWWYIGTFELVAETVKLIDIRCAGLDSAWVPSYVCVEVYRAW